MAAALLTGCREWMTMAISRLDTGSAGSRQEMIIESALASCTMFTDGMSEESYATWSKARVLAESSTTPNASSFSACSLGSSDTASPPCRGDGIGGSVRRCRRRQRQSRRDRDGQLHARRDLPPHRGELEAESHLSYPHRDDEASRPLSLGGLATIERPMPSRFWRTWSGCAALLIRHDAST